MKRRARISALLRSWEHRLLARFASPELTLAMRQLRHRAHLRLDKNHVSPFPPRSRFVTGEVGKGVVLVLAPHPDDEMIGLGGLLARHLDAGSEVSVVFLTDGRGPRLEDTSLVQVRRQEARSLGERYGFHQIFWDIPDTHLKAGPEAVENLAELIGSLGPDQIYLPSFFDHQYDHFAANELLASSLGSLPPLDLFVYGYEVWDNIPLPNYFVDISDVFKRKAEMLSHYAVPNQVTDFVALCRHRAALHFLLSVNSGRRQPEGYAEAFFRTDAPGYVRLFSEYREMLLEHQSPLVR